MTDQQNVDKVRDIINAALSYVGDKRINSFTENTTQQLVATTQYDFRLKAFLRQHPWNFASREFSAPIDNDTYSYEFKYAYGLPADCIAVRKVFETENWRVQGRSIVTDCGTGCNIRYTSLIDDPVQWDASFTHAFTLDLAMGLAYALTDNASRAEQVAAEAAYALRRAKSIDAAEDVSDVIDEYSYSILAARF